MNVPARTWLPARAWQPRAQQHARRADALTAAHRVRRAAGERHAIDDFLYDYYGVRPSLLRRWHPGPDVVLGPTPQGAAEHTGWRWYVRTGGEARDPAGDEVVRDGVVRDGVVLDTTAFLADRGEGVRHIHRLLTATASRPAHTGCFGLHEWAMVYRQDDGGRRHDLPLRLGRDGTDRVVESHQIRCSHIDAFRFFTPEAVPRNRLQPTRATQVAMEQPGCLHANMDLLKWALKLGPTVPGELLLDCFELARDIRTLDMQASPYDVSSLGERTVAIETVEGKAEYIARQRDFADRASALRTRLIDVCRTVLPGDHAAARL